MTKAMSYGLIAALACAVLLGCGGDSGVDRSTHDMLQIDLEAALADLMETEDERDTAQAEVARLNAQLLTANNNVASLTTRLATATADVTRLTNQIGSATDPASLEGRLAAATADVTRLTNQIGSATDATSLQGRLATATAQVTTLTSQLATERQRVATLQQQLTAARGQVATAQREAQQAQTEATQQIEEARQQGNVNVRAPLLLPVLGGALTAAQATVEWMRGGTLQFTAGSYTRGSSAPTVPGNWPQRASFTGTAGTTAEDVTSETIYLYSNIQPPGTRAIWKVHNLGPVGMTGPLAMAARGSSASPDADSTPATPGHQYTQLTIRGSLGGVGGTFTCSSCSGTVGGDGSTPALNDIDDYVTFAQNQPMFATGTEGNWQFAFPATSLNAGYQIDEDEAFLYFGMWASDPVDIDETPAFQYIAGGAGAITTTTFTQLTGAATFSGGAVGRYATAGQVGQQNAAIGTFTATATFTANLGDA